MNRNILSVQSSINLSEREQRNGHKAAVIWLTGLSGSGKTSIGIEVEKQLFSLGVQAFLLDGDNIRQTLSDDLGFEIKDRAENIRRAGHLCHFFFEAGMIVIAAIISPLREKRQQVRRLFPEGRFIEVFIDCSLEECEKRDPKGLYQLARKGELPFFTGVGSPFEPPENPEIHLGTCHASIEKCCDQIVQFLMMQKIIPS